VSLKAYNPSTKVMEEKTVAEYLYDVKGRLRAEWDPRISPALKTTYGYDAEGRVVSVSRPGQEPWLLRYGTTTSDANAGRLLSATRPAAVTFAVLKEQMAMAAPVNTAAPTLSGTSPVVGTTLSVSGNGTWSNSPLAYSYQWEDCYKEGESTYCSVIAGAVNQSYTPQARDAGYLLKARVSAQNPDGTSTATTSASSRVTIPVPGFSTVFGAKGTASGQIMSLESVAVDAGGHVWVADYANNRIEEFSSAGGFMSVVGWGVKDGKTEPETCTTTCQAGIPGSGNGQFHGPWGIAINASTGNIYVGDQANGRIEEFTSSGSFIGVFGASGTGGGQFSGAAGITLDPTGNVWVVDDGNNRVEEFSPSGTFMLAVGWGVKDEKTEAEVCTAACHAGAAGSGNGQFSGPLGMAFSGGNFYVVDSGNNRIEEFSSTGSYIRKFGSVGSGEEQLSLPFGIATEPVSGDLYVSECGNNRVQVFSPAGHYVQAFGTAGTGNGEFSCATGIASNASGELYVGDFNHYRVEKFKPAYSTSNPLPEPPSVGTSAVTTLEYHIALSGTGLPTMTKAEVEKWGQNDFPVEAMAIFPPVKPMGWPAKTYERATINYMDEQGHTVNVYTPGGGISTTEYNEINQVVRTLSADNRAAAMNETGKTVEASKKLDTQSFYNTEDQLTETLGPEHKVMLAVGKEEKPREEAMARDRVKYFYDEGSPEGKSYGLLTKTVDAALVAGNEFDKRVTVNSYSGQSNLGWSLRKPTSVTTDSGGLNLTTTTVYDSLTGNVLETRTPEASGKGTPVMKYFSQFGHEGSGEGLFKGSMSDAVDAKEDVWVSETAGGHIQEFDSEGKLLRFIGTEGTGELQFKSPFGLAVNKSTGIVYVVDSGNNRIEKLNSEGKYAGVFGAEGTNKGQFKAPWGVAVDAGGNVWVTDAGNNRVEEFSSSGTFIAGYGWGVSTGASKLETCTSTCQAGLSGSGDGEFSIPRGIVVSGTAVYVAEYGNNRVQQFSTSGAYIKRFGTMGSGNGEFNRPYGIAADPVSGDLYVADYENSRVGEFTPAGAWIQNVGSYGGGAGQLSGPENVAVDSLGRLWVADDAHHRMEAWELQPESPVYNSQFGEKGSNNGQFVEPRGVAMAKNGNVFVLDTSNSRVEEFSPSGTYLAKFGSPGTGSGQLKTPYAVAVDGKGNVWVADTGNNRVERFNEKGELPATFGSEGTGVRQFKEPKGIAVAPNGNVYVSDGANNRIQELDESGEFVAMFGYGVTDGVSKFEICTSSCRAGVAGSGTEGQFNQPRGVAVAPNGSVWVVDFNNNRVEEFNANNEFVGQFGSKGAGNGQFNEPKGIATDPMGNVWVTDNTNNRVEVLSPSGEFLTTFGVKGTGKGQFVEPWGIAVAKEKKLYVADVKNNRIEKWLLAPRPGNEGARYKRTAYYSSEGESEVPACRNHPEWANLPCQTEPVAQPGISVSPELPVTEFSSYNIWDELEVSAEKFGTVTRTKTQTYDAAGRALTSETKSTINIGLPKVTNKYNEETGALEVQSTESEAKTWTVTSVQNTLGELVSYTDAQANTAKYTYELEGRVEEMEDGKGSQQYVYEASTGFLLALVDSAAGTFVATRDVEGKIWAVSYPNKMTATYTYDRTGTATGIEYVKKTHCATTCPETWFSDTIVPSVHGESLKQTSTLSKENYSYDNDGRLLEAQETPTGKNCTVRLYAYDEESDRIGQTTRESGTETCATEGGVLQAHSYDSAGRLIDNGVTYDEFGNTLKLPSQDAEGNEVTGTYYVDNQIFSQTQNGVTIKYIYDPAGRTRETTSGSKTVIDHYAGPGEALAWTGEGATWTRDIPGIDGTLAALQSSAGTVTLQLHDLQGNIVGTASSSEAETKLLSSYNSTEFGVPNEGKTPPPYAWLGAGGVSTAFSSGIVNEGGASYVPQLAQSLQTAPVVPPGAFPNGQGTGDKYVSEIPGWIIAVRNAESTDLMEEYLAKQEALNQAATEAALNEVGEGEDPTNWYYAGQAEELAQKLEGVSSFQEWFDTFSSIFDLSRGRLVQTLESSLLSHFDGWDTIHTWDMHTAHLLNECASFIDGGTKYDQEHMKCRLEYKDLVDIWTPFGHVTMVNFFSPAKMAVCTGAHHRVGTCGYFNH